MKKILSILLSVVLMASVLPITSIDVSASEADDIVSIARGQIGSYGSDNNKFTSWYYGKTTSAAWCAIFVSWCANQTGVLGNAIPKRASCASMLEWFQNRGEYYSVSSTYVPQKGDIIFFDTDGSGVTHHVEIVAQSGFITENSKKKVRCIGGNTSNASFNGSDYVSEKNRYIYQSSCKVMGYAHPSYAGETNYSNNTYSFNFNANGGTLGSSGAFSVSYGKQFQVVNTTCTRSGYTFAGWNVKRNNDNKWYVDGQGWCTESQISSNGYIKKVYPNYKTLTFDDSWTSGIAGNCSYTFYAIWVKSRQNRIKIFMSPYGRDYDHLTAMNNATDTGYTQNSIYAWYVLYDGYTGALLNTYQSSTYSVELSIYDPDGEPVHSYNYNDSSDANWIGITPQKSGTYIATATISGDLNGSVTTTYEVLYDAELLSSYESISLNLNGTISKTTTITIAGSYPGKYGVHYSIGDSSIASASWGDWDGNSIPITVIGKKTGTTNVVISLYENYTGNQNVVKTITIPITVTANNYTVSFNANGGSVSQTSKTVTYSSTYGTLPTPTRSGYSFAGWYTSSTGGAQVTSSTTVTTAANHTLYAHWMKTTYNLVYDSNGGTAGLNTHMGEMVYTIKSEIPTRFGYTFLGWSKSASATSATYIPGDTITLTENTTLYAVWKQATISFASSNSAPIMFGGQLYYYKFTPSTSGTYVIYSTGSDDTKVFLYNSSGSELVADDDGGANTNFRLEYSFTAGTTYYFGVRYYDSSKTGTISLKFGSIYTITYNAKGGSGAPSSQKKDYGADITLSSTTPQKSGYTFKGWAMSSTATSAAYQPGDIFAVNANNTLYAVWEANEYSVVYDANGGSNAPVNQTKIHGTTLTLSTTVPIRSGYKFKGWSTSSTATSATYQPGGSYTANAGVVLYAVWEKTTLDLVIDSSGAAIISSGGEMKYYSFTPTTSGKFAIYSTGSDDTKVYLYDANGVELDNDDDNGDGNNFRLEYDFIAGTTYMFGIKYYSSSKTGTISFKLGKIYTVSYDSNGGSGSATPIKKDYGTELTVYNDYIPSRTGYIFKGWSTSSTATNAMYQPGDTFVIEGDNNEITLYAVWEVIQYTISYDANGGSGAPESQIKIYGQTLMLSDIVPTRTGYKFKGWSTSSTATSTTYQPGSSFTNNSNTILYAIWGDTDTINPTISIGSTNNIASNQTVTLTMTDNVGVVSYYWGTSSNPEDSSFITVTSTTSRIVEKTVSNSGTYYLIVKDASGNIEKTSVTFYRTILVKSTGGNVSTQQTIITKSGNAITLPTPTRSGYSFKGWSASSIASSATYQPGISFIPNADTTLYTVWEKEVVISSISIESNPEKSVYYIGDDFSSTGLIIKLNYSDGSTENVTNGFTTSGFGSTSAGTKTVTVTYQGYTDTFTVTVETPSITLSSSSKTIAVGDTSTITATTTPSGQTVTWTSSDTSVATVSNGTITTKSAGAATITAKFTYNGIDYTKTCVVYVTDDKIASGSCGDNANWELYSDGTLKITGSGATKNYGTQQSVPWYSYASQIKRIEIAETITKIGHYSFYCVSNLESVTTNNADLTFGTYAFNGKTTFYSLGAGALEQFVKANGHTLIKPENPETVLNPELIEVTMNSITLKPLSGYEYSMDGVIWQDSNVFTNLFSDTEYVFYQRIKDGVYKVSATSGEARFSTLGQMAKPVIEEIQNNTVTLVAGSGYEYSIDGKTWQSSNIFKNVAFDKVLTFYQRFAGEADSASEATRCIVPSAPEIKLIGATQIVLKAFEGYEYSLDGEYWQSSNVFTMLVPEFEYVVYQRYAGSDIYTVISAGTAFITNGQDVNLNPSSDDLVSLRAELLKAEASNNLGYDYNADGVINVKDLVRLKKYMAGMNVPLGTSENVTQYNISLLSQPVYLEVKDIIA